MSNRQRPELPRSPLYQSQIMSSPNFSSGSAQHRNWLSRQQVSDGAIQYPHTYDTIDVCVQASHSTPNFGASNSVPNFDRPLDISTRDEYFNANNAPGSTMSTRTASYSSSASVAVQSDLPSPLEHISQQAAAYRSRVSAASTTGRAVTRARVAEVIRRIDLIEGRRASAAAVERDTILLTPVGPVARDSALSSLELESSYLPTTRHRRGLLTTVRLSAAAAPPTVNRTNYIPGYEAAEDASEDFFRNRPTPIIGRGDVRPPIVAASTQTSPSPRHLRTNVAVPMGQEGSAATPTMHILDFHTDSLVLPRTRPTMTTPRVPEARDTAPLDPYARNNDFIARMASAEHLENEIGRLQRPTPPPAVGHGRPVGSGGGLPRARSRSAPRWQHDQENSEEAAMSGLQNEMRNMTVQEQEFEYVRGVMDNTPPRESRLERYMRD